LTIFRPKFLSKKLQSVPVCTVGSHITYRVYAKLIKIINIFIKVKILLVRMSYI